MVLDDISYDISYMKGVHTNKITNKYIQTYIYICMCEFDKYDCSRDRIKTHSNTLTLSCIHAYVHVNRYTSSYYIM